MPNTVEVERLITTLGVDDAGYSESIDEAVRALHEYGDTAQRITAFEQELAQAQQERDSVMDEGARLTKAMATDTEEYLQRVEKLNELVEAGAIHQETYNRALQEAQRSLPEYSGSVNQAGREVKNLSEDTQGFSNELADSAQVMGAFAGVNRGAGRALSSTGRTFGELGIVVSLLNPALGQTVIILSTVASAAGRVISTTTRMNTALAATMALMLNPVMLGVIAVAAAGFLLWKKHTSDVAEEAKKLKEILEELTREQEKLNMVTGKAADRAGKTVGYDENGKPIQVATDEETVAHADKAQARYVAAADEMIAVQNLMNRTWEEAQRAEEEGNTELAESLKKEVTVLEKKRDLLHENAEITYKASEQAKVLAEQAKGRLVIEEAERVERKRVAKIEKEEAEAGNRLLEQGQKEIENLDRLLLGYEKQAALAKMTAAERAAEAVKEVGGSPADQKRARDAVQAQEDEAEALAYKLKLMAQGAALMEQWATPQEQYNKAIEDLNRLLEVNAIDLETWMTAAEDAQDVLNKKTKTDKGFQPYNPASTFIQGSLQARQQESAYKNMIGKTIFVRPGDEKKDANKPIVDRLNKIVTATEKTAETFDGITQSEFV